MNITKAVEYVKQEKIKEIALQFTDISGILHTLWVPSKLLSKVVEEGVHTDGSSLSMVDVSKSDLKLKPDLNSFTILPPNIFPLRVARVICDIYEPESNTPFACDPRYILKKAIQNIKRTQGSSISGYVSSEIEFFLFEKSGEEQLKLIDEAGYLATPPVDRGTNLRLELSEMLRNLGIIIEKHHHEVPHGKSEFNIPYSETLEMADTIYLIKFLIKVMAAKSGLIASFMPKPFHGEYGAGLHTHINLRDDETNRNIFADPNETHGLSRIALNFMGGVLKHAKALVSITNPSVNSYKRLVPGWEAPVYISWANYNRSSLIRIPPGDKNSARLEYRPTDGSCNFYLAYASLMYAGIDGIQKKVDPPAPIEENIYNMSEQERKNRRIEVLPSNLGEALTEFSKSTLFKDVLGSIFFKKYLEIKMKEWKEFSVHVHEWERKKYLDV